MRCLFVLNLYISSYVRKWGINSLKNVDFADTYPFKVQILAFKFTKMV